VLAVAAVAFAVGAVLGAEHSSSAAPALAARFVAAWAHGDYASMYGETTPASQRAVTVGEFARAYEEALATATAVGERVVGPPRSVGAGVETVETVPVRVRTRLFGTLVESFRLPILTVPEVGARVAWSRSLAFPGLEPGERLSRSTALPPRAALLARDGSVLAEGPASAAGTRWPISDRSPLGAVASAVVGEVGPIPEGRVRALGEEGVPANAVVGVSGLELTEDARLRGTPGGELLAVSVGASGEGAGSSAAAEGGGSGPAAAAGNGAGLAAAEGSGAAPASVAEGTGSAHAGGAANPAAGTGRVLASVGSHAAPALRTTISPAVQEAAVSALGGQYGGVVAMEPATGEILGVAGIGLDAVQPPGSTFKMVTLSGALAAGVAHPTSAFAYATYTTLDGVRLRNANGEECGGTLVAAFAASCNSVFAPLGVRLGAARLVATAERFGFNHPTGLEGAAESTLPPAADIQGELATGSTAIGQDRVQASPLEMATVAATIADGGRRPTPRLVLGEPRASVRAIPAATARTVRGMMVDVVRFGTGTAAAIPGVVVAGKTGTAELGTPSACARGGEQGSEQPAGAAQQSAGGEAQAESCAAERSNPKNTDAWFAAFAPALHPRIAVAVLLVRDGAGGTTAAPVARQVLEAALRASG
jgi:hypothetical protein